MIITRAPLRITFGGGGTDLPSYYRKFGGELVAATIDKYIYIALHKTFFKEFIIKYSQTEHVQNVEDIQHPIIRHALQTHHVDPMLEVVSFADVPDGTGLGSSGAFTIALLRAITYYKRQNAHPQTLAEEACQIEIEKMGRAIGKQDQYSAAFGGITSFRFNEDDSVDIQPVSVSDTTLQSLEDDLLLFFTGQSRNASNVLEDQHQRSEKMEGEMLDNLHFTKELGIKSREALEKGNLDEFARQMSTHWENKVKRSEGMSNSDLNRAYQVGMDNGALGGKLIGAGGGGFFMFYTKNHSDLRGAMAREGLKEVRFRFDFEGAKVVSGVHSL